TNGDPDSYTQGVDAYRDITLSFPSHAVVGKNSPRITINADFDKLLSGKSHTLSLKSGNDPNQHEGPNATYNDATPNTHTAVQMLRFVDNLGGNGSSDISGMFSVTDVNNEHSGATYRTDTGAIAVSWSRAHEEEANDPRDDRRRGFHFAAAPYHIVKLTCMKRLLFIVFILLFLSCTGEDTRAPVPHDNPEIALRIPDGFPPLNSFVDRNRPTKYGVELGEKLFHEKKFSGNNTISCASCHRQSNAFADNEVRAKGIYGRVGLRNTPPIQNMAFMKFYNW